jgi:hypothetical protein
MILGKDLNTTIVKKKNTHKKNNTHTHNGRTSASSNYKEILPKGKSSFQVT